MNQDNFNTGITQQTAEMPREKTTKIGNILHNLWSKVPEKLKSPLIKWYQNKKLFWLTTVPILLIFFVIIIGLLFGTSKKSQNIIKPTPKATPAETTQPVNKTPEVTQTQSKLNDLKKQIDDLDVNQNRLKPPSVKFDIAF